MDSGLERKDMIDLERLKNQEVRRYMGERGKKLYHNSKEDVVDYMLAWADLLEEKLLSNINLPENMAKSASIIENQLT
jgi:Zn-dependent M28 family amino/carboxypeptidase